MKKLSIRSLLIVILALVLVFSLVACGDKGDDNTTTNQGSGDGTYPNPGDDDVTQIIDLLINTNISIRKIAQMYNVESNIIIGIKSGNTKIYRRKNFNYPLRPNN